MSNTFKYTKVRVYLVCLVFVVATYFNDDDFEGVELDDLALPEDVQLVLPAHKFAVLATTQAQVARLSKIMLDRFRFASKQNRSE